MSRSSLLLTISLLANLALVALLLSGRVGVTREPAAQLEPPVVSSANQPSADSPDASAAPIPAGRAAWTALHVNDDLPGLVARLRQAGFPPNVVRRIVHDLVAERFDAQRYEIDRAALQTPYWKLRRNSYQDPKIAPLLHKLDLEQDRFARELLGESTVEGAADTEEGRANLHRQFGELPLDKIETLSAYLSGYYEKQSLVYSAARKGGGMLGADWEKLIANEQEMRRDVAGFLTPAETEEFLLRNGLAADRLKMLLGPARVTEQEYRAILPLYQSLADTTPLPFASTSGQSVPDATRKAAEDAMLARLTAAVGAERAAELQIALDPKYSALNRLVSRLELPLSAAPQILATQQDVQRRATGIRNNTALSPDARAEQLTALAQEASTRLTTVLGGQRGLDAYRQNGGQWLDGLVPPKG